MMHDDRSLSGSIARFLCIVCVLLCVASCGEQESHLSAVQSYVDLVIATSNRDPQTISAIIFSQRAQCAACYELIRDTARGPGAMGRVLFVFCKDDPDIATIKNARDVYIDSLCSYRDMIEIPMVTSIALLDSGRVVKLVELSALTIDEVVSYLE